MRATVAFAALVALGFATNHIASLAKIFWERADYPYDVEWMEGGQLTHAYRVMHGLPLYGDCSDGWISFAYPPVHAWVLAAVGRVAGLDYLQGRLLSIAAFGLASWLVCREVARSSRSSAMGACLAIIGFAAVCAMYPYAGSWYDVIRVDSVYIALLLAGATVSLPAFPRSGFGARVGLSSGRIAAAVLLLTLAVLAKQTAGLFLPWICLHALWRHPRSGLRFGVALTASVFGSIALISWATDMRFYHLVFGVMSKHPLVPRQLGSNLFLTWGFAPYVFAMPLCGLYLLFRGRLRSRSAFWLGMLVNAFGASLFTASKLGAFLNNLMSLALLAGPVSAMLAGDWLSAMRPRRVWRTACTIALCAFASWMLARLRYDKAVHTPTAQDRQRAIALNRVVRRLGDVTMPSHSFLPIRNGSRAPQVHEQAYIDVMGAGGVGIDVLQCFAGVQSQWVVLDNVTQPHFAWLVELAYSKHRDLPARARVMAGFYTVPNRIMKRIERAPLHTPRHRAHTLFDFEGTSYDGWLVEGVAFAAGPSVTHNQFQLAVAGQRGARFANSFHPSRGDAARGRIVSPPFVIDRSHMSFRVGGGAFAGLRVELLIDGEAFRIASGAGRMSALLGPVVWDVSDAAGRTAQLAIIDEELVGWGHIMVDAVELFDLEP